MFQPLVPTVLEKILLVVILINVQILRLYAYRVEDHGIGAFAGGQILHVVINTVVIQIKQNAYLVVELPKIKLMSQKTQQSNS